MEVLPGAPPPPPQGSSSQNQGAESAGPACCVPGLAVPPHGLALSHGTRPSSPQGFQDRGRQSGHPPGHGCPRGRAHRHLPCAVHPGRQAAGQGERAPRASPSCRPPRSALPSVWDPGARGAAVGEGAVPMPRAQHGELVQGPWARGGVTGGPAPPSSRCALPADGIHEDVPDPVPHGVRASERHHREVRQVRWRPMGRAAGVGTGRVTRGCARTVRGLWALDLVRKELRT